MKPLKLTMCAFGSYGKETVIDFTKMDRGLFLITGDTGSGKTTIFDGITFAIYGETSGGKRDGKMMRSQFASPSDETFVELTFSYRGEIYTVRRSPEYMREKKRGSGLMKAPATVELTMPDGAAFRGKARETDKKLCEIMGIDREQFTQIAMIAQGDFLRLLHAKSEDRKKIFSTIFHTGLYRKVEEELGEKRKALKEKIGGAGERARAYVQSVEVPELMKKEDEKNMLETSAESGQLSCDSEREENELPLMRLLAIAEKKENRECFEKTCVRLEQAKTQLDEMKQEERPDMTVLREMLELFLDVDQQNLKKIKEPVEEAESRYGKLREKRGLAKSSNDVLDAYQRANADLEKILELEAGYLEEKTLLEQAERAYQVNVFYDRAKTAEQQLEIAKQKEMQSRGLFENKRNLFKNVVGTVINCDMQEKFQKIPAENSNLVAETPAKRLDVMGRFTKELVDSDSHSLTMWMSEWRAEEKTLEAAGRKMSELDARAAKVTRFERTCEKRASDLEQYMVQMSAARDYYGALQEQFLREQAGILAKERLLPGKPCPVCGSLEHPAPAVLSADAVTEAQVKRAQQVWEQKRAECEQMSLELRGDRAKIEEAKKQIEEARKEIPENYEERRNALQKMIEVSTRFLQAKEDWNHHQEEVKRLRTFTEESAFEYENARREAGFETESEYMSAVSAYRTKAQLDAEKKNNQRYFSALQEAKTTAETLKKQTEGKSYTDLALLDQDLVQWREKRDRLQAQKEQITRTTKNHERLIKTLEKEEKEYSALLEEFLLYDGLWQAAGGKIKGQVRMDFETYVQRMYFEKILAAANKRFFVFTNGKMKLKSRPMDEMGLMGSAGLEINVYVMATGKERDVKTLSGGESFLASLALALGLSDVVQSQAGSIRLESMFVDEGFGALDDGTREQAMRVLNDLAGDDRLVGIISHVNALKDSIERKLVVTRGLQGSAISWS